MSLVCSVQLFSCGFPECNCLISKSSYLQSPFTGSPFRGIVCGNGTCDITDFRRFFFFQVKMLLYTIEFSELLHFELQLRGGEK